MLLSSRTPRAEHLRGRKAKRTWYIPHHKSYDDLFRGRARLPSQAQEKAEKDSGRRPRLRDVARSAGLSEEAFASVMQAGMEARQKLVVCNLALVVSLANKYKRSHFDCGCLQV